MFIIQVINIFGYADIMIDYAYIIITTFERDFSLARAGKDEQHGNIKEKGL